MNRRGNPYCARCEARALIVHNSQTQMELILHHCQKCQHYKPQSDGNRHQSRKVHRR